MDTKLFMYRHVNTSEFQTYFKIKLQISKVVLDINCFYYNKYNKKKIVNELVFPTIKITTITYSVICIVYMEKEHFLLRLYNRMHH